ARHRRPELRAGVRLWKRLAVGAGDAGAGPGRIGAAAAVAAAARAHLIAPMLAAVILAAIDQVFRGRAECVVGLAKGRDLAVAVVVDADIEPDLRHPLGVAHRAGPGAVHLLRRAPALVDDAQRVDELGLPISLAPRLVPGERREGGKHGGHMVLLHQRIAERGLHAPQREQRAALDAKILLDPRKQRLVVLQRDLAVDDAPVGNAAIDVLPGLLGELRLAPDLLEYAHVGLDPSHGAVPGRFRDAFGERAAAESIPPLAEAGRRGACPEAGGEKGGCTETRAEHRAAGKAIWGISRFHGANLAPRTCRSQNNT